MLTLSLLLLAQATAIPAPAQAAAAPAKPEIVCIRAADPPPAFARWTKPESRPGIGLPFRVTAKNEAAKITFTVAKAGTYQIALSEAAWIDVMESGKALTSTGHMHGPACTGMRKIVDFKFGAGPHVLHLSKLKADTAKVIIVPALAR